MAGLLAWAADVVAGGSASDEDDGEESVLAALTHEQQRYVEELDAKASSLGRSIQDLRLRIPPPDISLRLPDLHAHSLASNAALAQQLNAHSATKEQTQLREVTLQEENVAYEKAILSCENKVKEKIQEVKALQMKLREMDENERILAVELENAQATLEVESKTPNTAEVESNAYLETEAEVDINASNFAALEMLENKKRELSSMEEMVKELESRWTQIQDKAVRQASPAQREKMLDKQLHGLLEQLAAKQSQAEALVGEVHMKEKELEKLNGLWKKTGVNSLEVNTARNRIGRGIFDRGSSSSDYTLGFQHKPLFGKIEGHQRPLLLRSAFVLYILILHILVFIKISF
ncbi:hypothetical protein MLD38_024547 [Melastoma candidum]|uniref:Uncharacterized protein n=1 Tax=Melastoma candidum TaxID=119954 RepID=A0ACB9NSL4_9MYRT|nr:hypothetical protein MLD38_024547 [Melastoma candidum]